MDLTTRLSASVAPFTRRLLAIGVGTALALGLATVSASPASAAPGSYVIDTDTATTVSAGKGSVTATIMSYRRGDRVRGHVTAIVTRVNKPEVKCLWARITWVYAAAPPVSKDDPRRICAGVGKVQWDLESDPAQDLVRVKLDLLRGPGSGTGTYTAPTLTEFVGDSPDSTGTAARLDRDPLAVTTSGSRLATAQVSWSIDPWTHRIGAQLSGSLSGPGRLSSVSHWVAVHWVYDDGGVEIQPMVAVAPRWLVSVPFTVTAPRVPGLRGVRIVVGYQDERRMIDSYGQSAVATFGDYYGS